MCLYGLRMCRMHRGAVFVVVTNIKSVCICSSTSLLPAEPVLVQFEIALQGLLQLIGNTDFFQQGIFTR